MRRLNWIVVSKTVLSNTSLFLVVRNLPTTLTLPHFHLQFLISQNARTTCSIATRLFAMGCKGSKADAPRAQTRADDQKDWTGKSEGMEVEERGSNPNNLLGIWRFLSGVWYVFWLFLQCRFGEATGMGKSYDYVAKLIHRWIYGPLFSVITWITSTHGFNFWWSWVFFVEVQLPIKWQPGRIPEQSHDHFLDQWLFSNFEEVGNSSVSYQSQLVDQHGSDDRWSTF